MSEAEVRLVSGEAVNLDIRLARAGSRALALMIDILVQLGLLYVLQIPLTLILLAMGPAADAALAIALQIMLVVLVLVGYPTAIHALMRGRSVGKLALGLRVVRDDGGPITWRLSFTRALVGAALEWPGFLFGFSWLISIAVLVGSARAQRLADLAAATIVIHERSPEGWGWVPSTPPPMQAWAATLDLTNVDDQLALAARHFLARSRSLREPHRTRLGEALAKELLASASPAPPPGTPGWAYLAAVVGERHRRAANRLAHNRSIQAKLWPELFPVNPAPATGPATPPSQLRSAAPR
ncbi:transporter [Rhizocola hellebori]|uniref:Transporter n=1 Tax=Rhizocola hellebori TaxID=1392758 RepID=A0A8J3QC85_9ACTN|nr:RDD family protein [Rhizocola hellebori]GIH07057.1 transporter [Rhizocola hellebori]